MLVIVIVVMVEKSEQPPLLLIKYVIVYVPAFAPAGVMAPVEVLIDNPDGLTENVPPVLPVIAGVNGGFELFTLAELHKTSLL